MFVLYFHCVDLSVLVEWTKWEWNWD